MTIEGSTENLTVHCRDCKQAKLSYLWKEVTSNKHKLHAQSTIRMAEMVKSHFVSKFVTEKKLYSIMSIHSD